MADEANDTSPLTNLGTGITLRDLFAAFALAGHLAKGGSTTSAGEKAYRAADSMLAVRSRKPTPAKKKSPVVVGDDDDGDLEL